MGRVAQTTDQGVAWICHRDVGLYSNRLAGTGVTGPGWGEV